jgi:hypothetical protein
LTATLITLAVVAVAYFVFMRWVLPRFGAKT